VPVRPPIHRPAGYKEKEKWQRSTKQQGKTTTERGYGAAWRKIRAPIIKRDDGLCQRCLRYGRVTAFFAVDHVIPKSKGGSDYEDNLECICKQCHKIKTDTEDKQLSSTREGG